MKMTAQDTQETLNNIKFVLSNDFSQEHREEALQLLVQVETQD